MAGMCDKIIHDYLGVNLQRVYETVMQDMPSLRSAIGHIVADVEKGGRHT